MNWQAIGLALLALIDLVAGLFEKDLFKKLILISTSLALLALATMIAR